MEDTCFICQDNLATVTFPCNHRMVCRVCCDGLLARPNGRIPLCPICRTPISATHDSTALQLLPVTVHDSTILANDLRTEYPYGCLLFGTSVIADANMVRIVQEAMAAVEAHRLTLSELKIALSTRLTVAQMQLVFVELIKHEDLHSVLSSLNVKIYERVMVERTIQTIITNTIESTDTSAILARGVVSAVADTSITLMTRGLTTVTSYTILADGASNLIVFSIFASLEVYRWAKGEISGKTAATNVGEHFVGNGAGLAGSYCAFLMCGGAAISTLSTGGVVGVIFAMLAAGMVCDSAGRWLYRKVLPKTEVKTEETIIEEMVHLTTREVAEKAASKFKINIDSHNFAEANTRFRQMLLANHPDKNPNAAEDVKLRLKDETRDILSCWAIVRQYYADNNRIADSATEESFIKLNVLKAKDTVTGVWNIVRTWIGNLGLGREPTENEQVDTVILYI